MKKVLFAAFLGLASAVNDNSLVDSLTNSFEQLKSYYDKTTGFFGDDSMGLPLWTTANQIETTANYYEITKDESALEIFENSYLRLKSRYCNCYRDDMLWYVIAWARVFEVTNSRKYLDQSVEIYDNLVGPWQAWNTSCGGMMWAVDSPYRNSITNELFFTASMNLHHIFETNLGIPDTAPRSTSGLTFYEWAQKDWTWINSTTLYLPSIGLFNDGMPNADCSLQAPSQGAIWTYNQGVLLDGLTQFGLGSFAQQVATTAFTYFVGSHSDGIMREISCNSDTGNCDGQDGRQFKGAFVRHLAYATLDGSFGDVEFVVDWLTVQVASILANSSKQTEYGLQLGQLWQGPVDASTTCPWVSQGSAMDAIIALLQVTSATSS